MSPWMSQSLAVFIGSGIGGTARFGVGRLVTTLAPTAWGPLWPKLLGTWSVNAIGSLVLTWLVARQMGQATIPSHLQLALSTGMMGGFTTYSTFNAEALQLWQLGRTKEALLYAAATVLCCALFGWIGWWLGSAAPR
ncbi:MAG TPA: fluoride efflux transporter CrcB [Myxococcales bacterium]|nr:fluoride efflux transporter CrcB [Myxococcales bacterium]HAN32320.1 fluoride efflux transporter CrcB [Myxococcales bacterium]